VVVVNRGVKKEQAVHRAGSNRSPLWKGGGVTFGPKPKTVSIKVNKKERRLALQTLLYNKKNNILVIENLENGLTDSKTKSFLDICNNMFCQFRSKSIDRCSGKNSSIKISNTKSSKR
jgi:large subunit ribosomal protein L4